MAHRFTYSPGAITTLAYWGNIPYVRVGDVDKTILRASPEMEDRLRGAGRIGAPLTPDEKAGYEKKKAERPSWSSAVRRDSLCPYGADARFYYSAAPSGFLEMGGLRRKLATANYLLDEYAFNAYCVHASIVMPTTRRSSERKNPANS